MKSKETFKVKKYFLPIIFIGLLVALDQLTKSIITGNFILYEKRPLIDDVFSFTYIQNTGIAWGMFKGKINILLIITALIIILCSYMFHNISEKKGFMAAKVCLIFIISGGIGNMIDRVKLGYVIDFLSFDLIDFPVFNVADIYVTVFTILLFVLILFKYSDEEFDIMLGSKKKAVETVSKNNDESDKDTNSV